jgi:hypothetical protein
MAELKTKPTNQSVEEFLNTIEDEQRRNDCFAIVRLMEKITKVKPTMWGPSIVGFGKYHYKYESGHEGDSAVIGFSPRKQSLTLYVMSGFDGQEKLMQKLGKYKRSVACIYLKKLSDIDQEVLTKLIQGTMEHMQRKYPVIWE